MFTRIGLMVGLIMVATAFSNQSFAQDFESSLSRADIEIAQAGLVEIGKLKVIPTGQFDQKTRAAIVSWRESRKVSVEGPLTKDEFEMLRKVDPLKLELQWSAVAASTDGKQSSVWNQKSGVAAMRIAMKSCKARSNNPKWCLVAAGYPEGAEPWPSSATHCKRRVGSKILSHIYVLVKKNVEEIREVVLDILEKDGFEPSQCRELITVDGTGQEY